MEFKKCAASAVPRVWTVAELGAFYAEYDSELLAHANRVLNNSAKAEEITQDARIKFMIATSGLYSQDREFSDLHRTIERPSVNKFILEGPKPSLV